jgi:hypothetical protein
MFFRVRSPMSLKARSSLAAAASCTRGYTDATRPPQGFEPGRGVDPAAEDAAVLDDDVAALVDADAEFDAALAR